MFERLSRWRPRAALELAPAERQALMTWGLLAGIIALSGLLAAVLWLFDRHWSPALARDLVSAMRWIASGILALQALLAFGMVAIARGGTLKMSVNRDGATVEAEADGGAARELAKDTSLDTSLTGGSLQ